MGWSCRKDAADSLQAWSDACFAQTGSQNSYTENGRGYFFERSQKEHADGAITGSFIDVSSGKQYPFRIEGDGSVSRGPRSLKNAVEKLRGKWLWIRCGDGDDYHRFDDLDEAATYLAGEGVGWPLFYQEELGLSDGGVFSGQNYVSAYWGGYDAGDSAIRGLSLDELESLNDFRNRLASL